MNTYYLVCTTPRTRTYFVGTKESGRIVTSDFRADAHAFADRAEAHALRDYAARTHNGTWAVTVRRAPTATADEIAARVAARRAERKANR